MERKIRFITPDRVKEIIREELDLLLLSEEMSVSREVVSCGNLVMNELLMAYNNDEPLFSRRVGILIPNENGEQVLRTVIKKRYSITPNDDILRYIPTLYRIIMDVIELPNEKTYEINFNHLNTGGQYDPNSNIISMTIPSINGDLKVKDVKRTLYHELEHSYQFSLACQKKNMDIYGVAETNTESNDVLLRAASRLIYYFHKNEIDANMHQLYADLESIGISTRFELDKCTPIIYRDKLIKDEYETIKNGDRDEVENMLKRFFNMSYESFTKYIDSQMRYFNSKVMKVYQYYLDKNNTQDIYDMENDKMEKM